MPPIPPTFAPGTRVPTIDFLVCWNGSMRFVENLQGFDMFFFFKC